MSEPTDYIGNRILEPEDKLDYGIKGMKWGVRRTDAQLAASKKGDSSSDDDAPAKKVVGAASGESSGDRYNRLVKEAREKGANSLDDQDLKFMNARSEAMAKVNKMNEQKPGWLSQATKTVVQKSAQRSMQSIADAVTDKYINDRIKSALKDNSAAVKAESKTAVDYVGRHRAKKST